MKDIILNKNGYMWVILPDPIGIDEGLKLQRDIEPQLSSQKNNLVLDFSRISIIYSAGFGLFIRLRKKIMELNGSIYLVNVSKNIRDIFTELMLDKVFPIFATDVEFELSIGETWKNVLSEYESEFIFVPNIENGIYRLTFSGQITSLQDLSLLSEFQPEKDVDFFLMDFQNIDFIDTYGAQLLNDFISKINTYGTQCVVFGIDKIHRDIFDLYTDLNTCEFFETEKEALQRITCNKH